jgi:iron complex transport system substrate-binding protein
LSPFRKEAETNPVRDPNAANSLLLFGAVVAGFALTALVSSTGSGTEERAAKTVTDATGTSVAVREYVRIVSTSTIADQVLVRIIDPSRLLAVSGHTLRTQDSDVYRGKIGVERARDIETIIELRPDLVFINNFVDRRHVERFKDAGLSLFDLGAMRGLDTLPTNIRQIADVLGLSERGEAIVQQLLEGLAAVSSDISEAERRRGLYVGIHGGRLFGGARGTSFHDVLVAGGLVDVAAEAGFTGWPAYTNEQLISLDPPWIITNPGTERALCRHPGFDALAACRLRQVRGIDTDLLTDPGLGMVDAARAVRVAVYGPKTRTTPP